MKGLNCLAMALAMVFLAGCGPAAPKRPQAEAGRRLLIVGVDGADWDAMLPLLRQGEMPHMERLIRQGYSARLTTMAPALSPVVWTTIATGKRPAQHGVRGFLGRDPETGEGVPVTSNMRRTAPFWSILGASGVPVSIVGWWVTWPAEEVNGTMVSPYAAPGQTTWKGSVYAEGRADQTWPRDLLPRIAPAIEAGVGEAERTFRTLFPEPGDRQAMPEYLQAYLKDTLWVHVSDTIFRDVGEQLLREDGPRLAAVYFGGVDVTGHRFWRFADENQETWPASEAHRRAYGGSLDRYYRWMDEALGRLLAAAPEGTAVMVVSDHGMELAPPRNKPPTDWNQYPHEISGGHTRGPDGILVFAGDGAASNFDSSWWDESGAMARLGEAGHPGVLDVAPLVLHYFGLPVGEDMAGRVRPEVFSDPLASRAVKWVETWDEPGMLPDPTPLSSPRMDEVKERLRGLGYID